MKKILFLCLCIGMTGLLFSWNSPPKKKLLVLIIASDNHPAFLELQNIWKSYMHLDPKNIEAYFIKGDAELSTPYEIRDDSLFTAVEDNYKPGILKKTILSMEALSTKLDNFDYVLRTNLSSFYDFPKLLMHLKTLPKERCYAAWPLMPFEVPKEFANIRFGWGAGFILSPDLVKLLIANKTELFEKSPQVPDDVLIGACLHKNNVSILPIPIYEFRTYKEWQAKKETLDSKAMHFRAKSNYFDRTLEHTFEEELAILSDLVKQTYPTAIPYNYQLTYPLNVKLETIYAFHAAYPSDINEHLPRLRQLAKESASVTEIGVASMVPSWALLHGLSESESKTRTFTRVGMQRPANEQLLLAKLLSVENDIAFTTLDKKGLEIDIEPTDFLFIDSLHTYTHLTYELETFSPKVKKVIALHDTSEPWGERDDTEYRGDYSEYPEEIDRTKRGLWPAVVDFLAKHPEWTLKERRFNNHGLTILERN